MVGVGLTCGLTIKTLQTRETMLGGSNYLQGFQLHCSLEVPRKAEASGAATLLTLWGC